MVSFYNEKMILMPHLPISQNLTLLKKKVVDLGQGRDALAPLIFAKCRQSRSL